MIFVFLDISNFIFRINTKNKEENILLLYLDICFISERIFRLID